MSKSKLILKMFMQLLGCIIIDIFIVSLLKNNYMWWILVPITLLALCYNNYEEININFIKKVEDAKDLFNTYYINYPKVFEIAMLINNKVKVKSELSYKHERTNKEEYSTGMGLNVNNLKLTSDIGTQQYDTVNQEYKEFQEIKYTNSIYLRQVIDKCKEVDNIEKLHNGDLIKINNVNVQIINMDEILQVNSIISGAFNGNTINTYSNGQTFKIDINSLINILLKDYKYHLKCVKNGKEFYVDIPMKSKKEFENEYSIYDLEIGTVNIIGIYRANKYNYENKNTFSKLQQLGGQSGATETEEIFYSNSEKKNKIKRPKLVEGAYIDLIAIIQDLSFNNKNGDNDNER